MCSICTANHTHFYRLASIDCGSHYGSHYGSQCYTATSAAVGVILRCLRCSVCTTPLYSVVLAQLIQFGSALTARGMREAV